MEKNLIRFFKIFNYLLAKCRGEKQLRKKKNHLLSFLCQAVHWALKQPGCSDLDL